MAQLISIEPTVSLTNISFEYEHIVELEQSYEKIHELYNGIDKEKLLSPEQTRALYFMANLHHRKLFHSVDGSNIITNSLEILANQAEKENLHAKYNLALCHFEGLPVILSKEEEVKTPNDAKIEGNKKAIKLFEDAALIHQDYQNNAREQFYIGRAYFKVEHTLEAIKHLNKSVEKVDYRSSAWSLLLKCYDKLWSKSTGISNAIIVTTKNFLGELKALREQEDLVKSKNTNVKSLDRLDQDTIERLKEFNFIFADLVQSKEKNNGNGHTSPNAVSSTSSIIKNAKAAPLKTNNKCCVIL